MSRPEAPHHDADDSEPAAGGINLKLVYSLIALAMLVAIGLAGLIILPFYLRR